MLLEGIVSYPLILSRLKQFVMAMTQEVHVNLNHMTELVAPKDVISILRCTSTHDTLLQPQERGTPLTHQRGSRR